MEFVLLGPILILLLVAMVDFGRAFDAWVVSTNAAREGARYASIYATKDYLTTAQVQTMSQQKACAYLTAGLGSRGDVVKPAANNCTAPDLDIGNVTVSVPSRVPGEPVTVTVTVRVQIWALMSFFLSNEATLTGEATMRI